MKPEAGRLRTLRRRRDYLVQQLEDDAGDPGTRKRDHLRAEASALTWAIQELQEVEPELHAHTIKVVKESLAKHLRLNGVDPSVIELVREHCNRLTLRTPEAPLPVSFAMELAERDD